MTPCTDIYLCVRRFFRSTFFVEKQKKRTFARRLLSKGPFWESLACVNSMFFGQACGS